MCPNRYISLSDCCGDLSVLRPEISLTLQLHCSVCRVPSAPSPSFVSTLFHTQSVHRSDTVTSHTLTVTDDASGTGIVQLVCGWELEGYTVLVEEIVHVLISYVRTLQEKI